MEYSLGIALGVLGVCMVLWAVVRPRRGSEKFCRPCGFSLAGLTAPARCPECGRGLAARRAVVVGHRPSPKRAVVWGAVLVGFGAVLVGLDAMNRSGFFPLTRHKPSALLQVEAYVLGDLRASMATDEIVARVGDGTLGPEAETRLVATALVRHAQTWRVFPDAQWMVITRAMGRNDLSFEQIERVWDNLIESVEVVPAFADRDRFLPGEYVGVVVSVRYRAGTLVVSNLSEIGFAVSGIVVATAEDGRGGSSVLPIVPNGFVSVVQRQTPGAGSADEHHIFRITTPNNLGKYRVTFSLETRFPAKSNVTAWTWFDAELLGRLSKLLTTHERTLTLTVAEMEVADVPQVSQAEIWALPDEIILFTVEEPLNPGPTGNDPGVLYSFGTPTTLDPEIGLGGFIVFAQGDKVARFDAPYSGPHSLTKSFVPLRGFGPGPVRVWYEHDADRARLARDRMKRVVGGTVDLGSFEIPERTVPDPE